MIEPWTKSLEPYCDVFNEYTRYPFSVSDKISINLQDDFIGCFRKFLTDQYSVPITTADAIVKSVYNRMSDRQLYYHTPAHILCIFGFAQKHKITIESWEELALWFHDSIYMPDSSGGSNERNSAQFMQCMMKEFIVNTIQGKKALDYNMLLKISTGITITANHLMDRVGEDFHKILDLDLCSFSFEREKYLAVSSLIRKEYPQLSNEAFEKGRMKFLNSLIEKGYVYRTPLFKERFEEQAMANIKADLA